MVPHNMFFCTKVKCEKKGAHRLHPEYADCVVVIALQLTPEQHGSVGGVGPGDQAARDSIRHVQEGAWRGEGRGRSAACRPPRADSGRSSRRPVP